MKNYISISFAWALQIVVLLILAWTETDSLQAQTVWNADNLPIPHYQDKTQWVSNPDQVVSPQETDSINALINRLHQSHDVEILVVAVKRLENGDCYETGMALARKHGIGDKKKNNGLIILLSTEDRSYYILTGHGLEGVLPDIICNRIETHYMVPLFKEGKWGEGLFAGVKAISRYLEGDAEPNEDDDVEGALIFFGVLFFIILIVAIIVIVLPQFKTCPKCGKKRMGSVTRQLMYTRGKTDYYKVVYMCRACRYTETRIERSPHVDDDSGSAGAAMLGGTLLGGGRGGFSGGSFGGGSFGGGGAGGRF